MTEMFSTRLRYSGASLTYQVSGVLGGGLAPLISLKLLDVYGTATAVAVYVAAALCLTIVSLLLARETRDLDLHAEREDERRILETAP
jgi:hypothetical protein